MKTAPHERWEIWSRCNTVGECNPSPASAIAFRPSLSQISSGFVTHYGLEVSMRHLATGTHVRTRVCPQPGPTAAHAPDWWHLDGTVVSIRAKGHTGSQSLKARN